MIIGNVQQNPKRKHLRIKFTPFKYNSMFKILTINSFIVCQVTVQEFTNEYTGYSNCIMSLIYTYINNFHFRSFRFLSADNLDHYYYYY